MRVLSAGMMLLVTMVAEAAPRQDASIETLARPIALRSGFERIAVEGAASLRLQISGAVPGTVLWLAGQNDAEFEPFEVSEAVTWGPTIEGPVVYVAAAGGSGMSVTKLAIGTAAAGSACLIEAACGDLQEFPELEEASRAIAMIRFVRGDASYVCTGALMEDAAKSGTPYLLTAQHCIATAEEAASVEAVWDARSGSCGGAASRGTRTYGAELLVSSAATDVALLRLKRIPPDRVFLRPEPAMPAPGAVTYRLSHADGAPQTVSSGVVRIDGASCPFAPRSQFIYTSPVSGTVAMGSSGAPLLLPGLRVAGQLLGRCGPSAEEPCAAGNDSVDGSIAASWPLLAQYLDAQPATPRRRAARH
jgi:hypothetical protein